MRTKTISVLPSLLALAFAGSAYGQSSSAPGAVVFAPGTVSVEGGNVYRGAFSPDRREYWFFRKVTEGAEDYRIFVSRHVGDGWSEPERVLLGGEYSDLYPSISPDGSRLVFASYRPVPGDPSDQPNANLWYADRAPDGSWGEPVLMGKASTLANYDNNPRFLPDGSIEFGTTTPDWSTSTQMITRWTGTEYGPPERDARLDAWAGWRDDAEIANATFSPDESLAILDVRFRAGEGRLGPSDLWYSRRDGTGWTDPRPLAGGVNTPEAFENFVVFTPDGREILFVRDFHLTWRIATEVATPD